MTVLIVLTLLTVFALGWLFRRDARYRKSSIRDLADTELKKHLNLKHPEARFDTELLRARQMPSKSAEILKSIDEL